MTRIVPVRAPRLGACRCGAQVSLVPSEADNDVMVPMDVDRSARGGLVLVGSPRGYTVRLLSDGDGDSPMTRRAHWEVCPLVGEWVDVRRAIGSLPATGDTNRMGPCARCGCRNPHRYGGPIASPLCDECLVARGLSPIG